MNNVQWGIIRAFEGQFVVPDIFSNATILPVTPNICFSSQKNNDFIDINEVAQINRLAIESSYKYFFANDLSKCP